MATSSCTTESKEIVLSYLVRVAEATATLCLQAHQGEPPTLAQKSSGADALIQQIAQQLLEACHLNLIGTPLPIHLIELEEQRPCNLDEDAKLLELDEDDEPSSFRDWKRNRTDYLRMVLRGLPPIALDVGAHICTILLSSRVEGSIPNKSAASAFVLFGNWLSIAPQLAPLVSDLFLQNSFPCPLDYSQGFGHVELLLAEAAHHVYEFYAKRRDHAIMTKWWDWGHLFTMLICDDDVVMKDDKDDVPFNVRKATRWHAARAIGFLIDLRPKPFAEYLDRLQVRESRVPWVPHPWIIHDEEDRTQNRWVKNVVSLWDTDAHEFQSVSSEQVRQVVSLHSLLAHVGEGIVFVRDYGIRDLVSRGTMIETVPRKRRLIMTPTTSSNLSLLGAAMCTDPYPAPILVCGPPGSGKSSLVRELAHYCCTSSNSQNTDYLMELHVDEETDSKTLIGSYTTTDTPGEFTWRPGALTQAVRAGKWVLMEDVDTVPSEIQAAIVQLLENRMLPLGTGKYERCHPKFRLFGTCTTNIPRNNCTEESYHSLRLSGKKLVSPSLWRKVIVQPMAFSELKQVGESLHPSLPPFVLVAALNVLKALDQSGRVAVTEIENPHGSSEQANHTMEFSQLIHMTSGRHASVRDFLKLLSRISHTVPFERYTQYVTESQRTLCLAETTDVFAAACPSVEQRREFITNIAAPYWGITADLALNYIEARQPSIVCGPNYTEIGRAKIPNAVHEKMPSVDSERFAPTSFAKRLMESIGVCVAENEPTLLVGETGSGKTSLLQELAKYSGRELIVQNLSLQTDSTDLLGGYRPLEMPHIARKAYLDFVDIFVSTFSRKQNAQFLNHTLSMLEKRQWKRLSQCFRRAAALGLAKVKKRDGASSDAGDTLSGLDDWSAYSERAEQFERQRLACESGLAFAFTEGAMVDAIRTGKWVLLDEINLASSEMLQRLCGLLDDSTGSVTLTERGDAAAVKRHPDFRLFAAMNPATDAGKKDLPPSIRARFAELYVDELLDAMELRTVAAKYLQGIVAVHGISLEHSAIISRAVEVYLRCRYLAEQQLIDASGHKPRYTMRTMCRALSATRNLVFQQRLAVDRSVLEGFELAFEGNLDESSAKTVKRVLHSLLGKELSQGDRDHPPRRPGSRDGRDAYVLVKPFWVKAGPVDPVDWSDGAPIGRSRFVLTSSMTTNLRRLARAVAAGPWPVLLEGPTSAGKTTLVEYLAARCGHVVVRINNHEHTDVQEYTGGYASGADGKLSFRDGILVRALRRGHWVILDELNLAPSEVLEALNRLLDDNRELYLPEVDETVRPHPTFRLFATQNPSGAYGGRKPLSRAFRNRFVEIHMGDIPAEEMRTILENRCACPPSHARALVKIMIALRQRRNAHGVFLGKDGLVTPRDLLRWAERGGSSKLALAQEGYMLLAERLRNEQEKEIVRQEIEAHLNVTVDLDEIYYGENSEARLVLRSELSTEKASAGAKSTTLSTVAPTKSLLRLLTLVLRCIRQQEPVLLVGDTGCGKTTVVQLLHELLHRELHIVNCHATTETSDLIGGLRPVRGRGVLAADMLRKFQEFLSIYPDEVALSSLALPDFVSSHAGGKSFEELDLPDNAARAIMSMTKLLWNKLLKSNESRKSVNIVTTSKHAKKRKLASGRSLDLNTGVEQQARLKELVSDIFVLFRRLSSLFEWSDGPLVTAMRAGHLLLLDEMSLAEDAVLERLNSVLEPSRTLVLAEKCADALENSDTGHTVIGHDDFRIFATMNPGGDFGKRELSPALRSRFTEIWVPQVTDPSDIEMVLGYVLNSAASRHDNFILKEKILNYVNWFNVSICGKPGSACADLALSLRDVIAWARFVVDVSIAIEDMNMWVLYCHGACLMHLDGLGLGTGLSIGDARTTKKLAISFLLSEIPGSERNDCLLAFEPCPRQGIVTGSRFGIAPFTTPTGNYPVPSTTFDFDAPTPWLNLLRLMRAMQISKPILLEGSPGVGKTSLVKALAEASGHRLVRINLSEQTDISDLMGSDLPNPDHDGADVGSSFKWCDGVLLRAIKQGDWVLLDELNLASQSVLEGLNSCLDHRASVFIPELGKTFECPSTFRIFAAQNPLAQGGGRKGLPKSFLNRFTKVYLEALEENDLHSIISSRFPTIPRALSQSMIAFNRKIHAEVVENEEYGHGGSPWEFNLRDVFRWCLLVFESGSTTDEQVARFARHLYLYRFRSMEDRWKLSLRYQAYFKRPLEASSSPELWVNDDSFAVGEARLNRRKSPVADLSAQVFGDDSVVLRSLLPPLEAVARCVTMNWPCLLVGESGTGKTSLLQSLAELNNAPLINVSLTPATDVNELIGCFEQVDSTQNEKECIQCFRVLHDASSVFLIESRDQLLLSRRISHAYQSLLDANSIPGALKLASLLAEAANANQTFYRFSRKQMKMLRNVLERIQYHGEREKGRFRWVDGVLVEAMTKGHWIHLENANLCPASVLDRLNPVMEENGELLLTECGVQDLGESTGTTHRVVKRHPDFRIFLSMNPSHGEISRAMRNRCVEIALLSPTDRMADKADPTYTLVTVDCNDLMSSIGVRSAWAGMSLLKVYQHEIRRAQSQCTEIPPTKSLIECGGLSCGLGARGRDATHSLASSYRLSYGVVSAHSPLLDAKENSGALSRSPRLRWDWSFDPRQAQLDFELRPVRVFSGQQCSWPTLDEALLARLAVAGEVKELSIPDPLFRAVADPQLLCSMIQNNVIALFLGKSHCSDLAVRSGIFHGYNDVVSCYIRFMAHLLGKVLRSARTDSEGDSPLLDSRCQDDALSSTQLNRLSHLVREEIALRRIASLDQSSLASRELTVMEASICLHDGKLERSLVLCPVTPVLYPLLLALDEWMNHYTTTLVCTDSMPRSFPLLLEDVMSHRDQLYVYLDECVYNFVLPTVFLGFDESGFIVQWVWLKKKLNQIDGSSEWSRLCPEPSVQTLKKRLDLFIETVDRALFDSEDFSASSADVLWKKGGHPLSPRQANQWQVVARLNEISLACSLHHRRPPTCEINNTVRTTFDLGGLIHDNHPVLYVSAEARGELLAALCTCYCSFTEEVRDCDSLHHPAREPQQLHVLIQEQLEKMKQAFVAQVRALRVDLEISTVENMMDVEALASLREDAGLDGEQMDQDFLQSLLVRYAKIQIEPIAEFWCVREEAALVEGLAEILFSSNDGSVLIPNILNILQKVKVFLQIALLRTTLPVVDLRPYQTLVWAASGFAGKPDIMRHLLRCLLPRMSCTLSQHLWNNSFTHLGAVSHELEFPSLWDSYATPSESHIRPNREEIDLASRQGPPGLNRRVFTDVVFRLVGPEISSMVDSVGDATYSTVENHIARTQQARALMHLASSLRLSPQDCRVPCDLIYFIVNTFEALTDFFPIEVLGEVLPVLKDPKLLLAMEEDYLCNLLRKCTHPTVRKCMSSVVEPLLSSLRAALNDARKREKIALCWVYLGLLRMNLLVPRSPLDPGKKPIAKALQLKRQLHELQGRIIAARIDSTLLRGLPTPTDERYRHLTAKAGRAIEKQEKQERKSVERSAEAPPFIDLFRESRQFLKTVAGDNGVLALLRSICDARKAKHGCSYARDHEKNWQITASSFISRMLNHFASYEDVILPFVQAVQNIRDGIRLLADLHLVPHESQDNLRSFESLLTYPLGNVYEKAQILPGMSVCNYSNTSSLLKITRYNHAVSLAKLCFIDVHNRSGLGRLTQTSVMLCDSLFDNVLSSGSVELGNSAKTTERVSPENALEEQYREQFPNHAGEFQAILDAIEMGDYSDAPTEDEGNDADEGSRLSDAQIEFLCRLHRQLFSGHSEGVDDQTRARTFCAAYSAAHHLAQVRPDLSMGQSDDFKIVGGHLLALSIRSTCLSSGIRFDSEVFDFHRDANPREVAKASRPLQMFVARATQLLTAFPGHAVLIALVRVADRVRKLPLSTSLGKAMSGLELLLRKAQDWEQHASIHVKLGTPLQEVSRLVACWRKLELQSWGTLIQARECRFAGRARRHWPRLYSILIKTKEPEHYSHDDKQATGCVQAPAWVWSGLKQEMGTFTSETIEYDVDSSMLDLTQLMDTFLLTSPLGEFRERLDLVEAFARQVSLMSCCDGRVDPRKVMRARMLVSLLLFYKQFLPVVMSRMSELRRPIEDRLRNEVRLAKWDEQTYYALAESSERNKRKLMKLLREYDAVLEIAVSSELEKALGKGIRSNESTGDEPCNSIPPYSLLFPCCDQCQSSDDTRKFAGFLSNMRSDRIWIDPEQLGLSCDKYVSQMNHYARRMSAIAQKQCQSGLQWSQLGTVTASFLSTAIFERVESLRKDKTTKPMKERALVDLFKVLKRNGYRHTKWSVPEHVRRVADLFQLPTSWREACGILTASELDALDGSDMYFQRTVAEMNRLRPEVLLLGSKHMSQRQTQMMLSFVEHGILVVCQQRCVLSRLLTQAARLDKTVEESHSLMSLPLGQTYLRKRQGEFNDTFLSAMENIKQLQFLMTTSLSLVEDGGKTEAIRDMISLLESIISSLRSYAVVDTPELLSFAALCNVTDAGSRLREAHQAICDCQRRCQEMSCFPTGVFATCISEVDRASRIALEVVNPRYSGSSVEVSSVMEKASAVVKKVILAVQRLCNSANGSKEAGEQTNKPILQCHSFASKEFAAINLDDVNVSFSVLISELRSMHDADSLPKAQRDACVSVVSGASVLLRELLELAARRLVDYIYFSRSTAKLNYVLVRIFRVLVSKGYCADNVTDDMDGVGEGDISGMAFEDDKDGTGMGEGDGKKDVSDQLESEEQLLGLKREDQDDKAINESKQLNDEEANQGMEMEGDFEGDMFDVPEPAHENEGSDDDDEEKELEREMGDGADPKEEIIDEKMWDNSDDGDHDASEEKFEEDSGVNGEALQDEMRTRGDGEEAQEGAEAANEESNDTKPNETEPNETETAERSTEDDSQINEDLEDNYEERPFGVDVRDVENATEDPNDEDDPMQLDDAIELDEGADAETEQDGEGMDIDEEGQDEVADDVENDDQNGAVVQDQDDGVSSEVEAEPLESGGQKDDADDSQLEGNSDDEVNEETTKTPEVDFSENNDAAKDAQGIRSKDGRDNIVDALDENEAGEDDDSAGNDDQSGKPEESRNEASSDGKAGGRGDNGGKGESSLGLEGERRESDPIKAPNPFKDPGDAKKFWHRKLNMVDGAEESPDDEDETGRQHTDREESEGGSGDHEFTSKNQDNMTQVLGEADQEDAARLDDRETEEAVANDDDEIPDQSNAREKDDKSSYESKKIRSSGKNISADAQETPEGGKDDKPDVESTVDNDNEETGCNEGEEDVDSANENIDDYTRNRVVSDLSQLHVDEPHDSLLASEPDYDIVIEEERHTSMTSAADARLRWSRIQGETHHLARRLCEKLRLVMEPLVATKLKGDYRTGKRINMKRVIPYIASGYRKDKIWLRRTKPAKRNYRVLLAVDNSESMLKSGAGEMALAAMATLAVGMSQLEIGELGVASFGEEMRLLHPFQQPFTSDSGVNVVHSFPFDEKRTRTALCVESALSALESQGDAGAMQLVFLISDGRIERDSRDKLRRLVREMVEQNVLLVMIIVEGGASGPKKKKDSIVHMKEVTFEKGKPVVKQFIEGYPFPYYMVLDDMQSLPEILGDALKQWFEMIAQLQGSN